MKTYVINMEKDVQKRALIESQLAKQKELEVIFFKAIEGRKLTKEELESQVDMKNFRERYGDFATLPAIGCALSHWNIYKLIAEGEDEYALVLEDDALLSENMVQKIRLLENWLLTDTPVVILLTPEFVYGINNKVALLEGFTLYRLMGGTMASGYVINKKAACLLKEKLFPVSFLADVWEEFIRMGLYLYGVVPHIVSYPEGLGEIGRSQQDKSKKGVFKKVRFYLGYLKGRLYLIFCVYLKGLRISRKKW